MIGIEELKQEEALVARAGRDPRAFGELYEKYYQPIFHYILGRTASVEIALDLTSTVFLKALSEIKRFCWQGVPFSAWLYRIASNEVASYYRKEKRRTVPLDDAVELTAPDDPLGDVIEAEMKLERHRDFLHLHRELLKLPDKYQEVIVLRFFEDRKLSEIASILGKSEGTVKSLLHRGLEKLRAVMA